MINYALKCAPQMRRFFSRWGKTFRPLTLTRPEYHCTFKPEIHNGLSLKQRRRKWDWATRVHKGVSRYRGNQNSMKYFYDEQRGRMKSLACR